MVVKRYRTGPSRFPWRKAHRNRLPTSRAFRRTPLALHSSPDVPRADLKNFTEQEVTAALDRVGHHHRLAKCEARVRDFRTVSGSSADSYKKTPCARCVRGEWSLELDCYFCLPKTSPISDRVHNVSPPEIRSHQKEELVWRSGWCRVSFTEYPGWPRYHLEGTLHNSLRCDRLFGCTCVPIST